MNFKTVSCAARALLVATSLAAVPVAFVSVPHAQAAVVSSISVQGAQRMATDTILSYVSVNPGRNYSNIDIDNSLKALYATGLFEDVQIFRSGNQLVVRVVENPTIANVIIRGNKKVKTKVLEQRIRAEEVGVLSDAVLESDRERIEEEYRRIGREDVVVNVRKVPLANNRANVVFEIEEGGRTRVDKIIFVGNNTFSDRRLREVMSTKQTGLLSWLRRDDVYDQDRLMADEEVLARYYNDRGFADFQVLSSVADLDEKNNEYNITVSVDEGERYKFGNVSIDSTIDGVSTESLARQLKTKIGNTYSARRVEETVENLNRQMANKGFAFSQITPRGQRNFDDRTIDVVYIIDEGPRAYIERINVVGNTRTRDYVIRREFDLAEGDAFNQVLVDAAERRLQSLGFFDVVRVTTAQGSAADRVVLNVEVKDKSTGSFSFGGGYSTNGGFLANISISERNFMGRGQYLKVSAGFGEKNRDYEFAFTEPYFLGRRVSAGVSLYNRTSSKSSTQLYDSESKGGTLTFGVPLTQRLHLATYYQIDSTAYDNSTSTSVTDGTLVTSAVGYRLTYNGLDNLRNPRNGIYSQISQTFAGLGGDVKYLRSEGKLVGYYTVHEDADIVLMGNVRGAHVDGLGDKLSHANHLSLNSKVIRGFAPGEFGPKEAGANGAFTGAKSYAAATGEVQFPIPVLSRGLGVRGALFADAAYIGSGEGASLGEDAFRASVGGSILWQSPLGPLRGDFAHVLTKESTDKTQVFNFGISTAF